MVGSEVGRPNPISEMKQHMAIYFLTLSIPEEHLNQTCKVLRKWWHLCIYNQQVETKAGVSRLGKEETKADHRHKARTQKMSYLRGSWLGDLMLLQAPV